MGDNEEKPIPSTSSQKPTTSKPATVEPSQQKPSTSKPLQSVPFEIDRDLECDFAYSAYLRTIISNQMIEEKMQKSISDWGEQLAQQVEVLQILKDKQYPLEHEVKVLEVKQEVQRVYKALKEIYDEIMNKLEEYNVDQNLNKCIKVGEEEANKVYLKNITPLKNCDEYEKLLALVIKCNDSIDKFKKFGSHATEVQLLRDNVVEFHRLSKKFEITRQFLLEQHQILAYNTFKAMSDQFAKNDKFKKS